MARRYLFTSESVGEGHPDKVADQISDAVLDAALREDIEARVACETTVTQGLVVVAAEITQKTGFVEVDSVARRVIGRIGYNEADLGFDHKSCGILTSIRQQSPDISQGVTADTKRKKPQGAGDQGMMFGFACKETAALMPMPIFLAHRLVEQLSKVRNAGGKGGLPWLRPDSKSQVTIEYDGLEPIRLDTLVISTQHSDDRIYGILDRRGNVNDKFKQEIHKHVIQPVLREFCPQFANQQYVTHINPTGRFVTGGPQGDTGLTGRKIIVDTYGGRGRHGGGAFSGKDPSKVDRSAAYMARYLAKNVVAAGLADVCEVQLAYAIGVAKPVSVFVDALGTARVDEDKIQGLIEKYVDLTPAGIIDHLQLLARKNTGGKGKNELIVNYEQTASYGHFGRVGAGFTWEKPDLAPKLRSAAAKWMKSKL